MFAWALGVVGYTSEVGLEKVLQDAADQRGILPLLFLHVLCLLGLCCFRMVVLLDSICSPLRKKESYFAEL